MDEMIYYVVVPMIFVIAEAIFSKRLEYRVQYLESLVEERLNSQNVLLESSNRILDARLTALETALSEKEE